MWAQNPPQKMSYQAVIRDATNHLVKTQVAMRISIRQGTADGTAVYTETQTPTPNINGLVTIEIGTGTTTDDFSAINWANGPYFIKTETDPEGGTNYTAIVGTNPLLSVPYALYAAKVANLSGTNTGDNATNTLYSGLVTNATHTGDVTGSEALTLATVNSNVGTFNNITISAKGLATAGSNVSYLTSEADPNAVLLTGNQTIAGDKTFTGTTTVLTPVNATDAANKTYVDDALQSQINMLKNSLVAGGVVTDYDNNIYNIVKIGTQVWMSENLKTTKYNDGTAIPNITVDATWVSLTTGAYCDYSNTPANSITYGRLYNWYAVDNNVATKMASNGGKNVCPTGWHVPTDAEWTTLENYLIANGYNYDGTTTGNKIAKAMASTTLWGSDGATGAVGNTDYPAKRNATGFTALPGGMRRHDSSFDYFGYGGYWWSATELSESMALYRYLYYYLSNVGIDINGLYKKMGFSVRCTKD
jgi:uncharacterized protein (TIGR02145 family)